MATRRDGTAAEHPAPQTCASCGRRIEWRHTGERDPHQVRWCSQECRRHGVTAQDTALERAVLALLDARAGGATVCPSEAARAVGSRDTWRELMEPARRAARRLVAAGEVEITQRGQAVDPSTATGPIRIRRVR